MLTLQDILKSKGSTVHSIPPETTVADAVAKLVEHNVGSLLVFRKTDSGEELAGIITERDLLHHCASSRCHLEPAKVADIMTKELVTASPEAPLDVITGLMTRRRIRHLPVFQHEKLIGIVSIGDVVKAQHDHLAMENQFMKNYIQG